MPYFAQSPVMRTGGDSVPYFFFCFLSLRTTQVLQQLRQPNIPKHAVVCTFRNRLADTKRELNPFIMIRPGRVGNSGF